MVTCTNLSQQGQSTYQQTTLTDFKERGVGGKEGRRNNMLTGEGGGNRRWYMKGYKAWASWSRTFEQKKRQGLECCYLGKSSETKRQVWDKTTSGPVRWIRGDRVLTIRVSQELIQRTNSTKGSSDPHMCVMALAYLQYLYRTYRISTNLVLLLLLLF